MDKSYELKRKRKKTKRYGKDLNKEHKLRIVLSAFKSTESTLNNDRGHPQALSHPGVNRSNIVRRLKPFRNRTSTEKMAVKDVIMTSENGK